MNPVHHAWWCLFSLFVFCALFVARFFRPACFFTLSFSLFLYLYLSGLVHTTAWVYGAVLIRYGMFYTALRMARCCHGIACFVMLNGTVFLLYGTFFTLLNGTVYFILCGTAYFYTAIRYGIFAPIYGTARLVLLPGTVLLRDGRHNRLLPSLLGPAYERDRLRGGGENRPGDPFFLRRHQSFIWNLYCM